MVLWMAGVLFHIFPLLLFAGDLIAEPEGAESDGGRAVAGQYLDANPLGTEVPGYLARVERNAPIEVEQALKKAEAFFLENDLDPDLPVIAFVLHGPEVDIFFRKNYQRYRSIVDLAARLSALKVVEIKICRTQLRHLDQQPEGLLPFVETVPFGPAEIDRLTNSEGYVYF